MLVPKAGGVYAAGGRTELGEQGGDGAAGHKLQEDVEALLCAVRALPPRQPPKREPRQPRNTGDDLDTCTARRGEEAMPHRTVRL